MTHTVELFRHDAYNCTITAQIRAADQSDFENFDIVMIMTTIISLILSLLLLFYFSFPQASKKKKGFFKRVRHFFCFGCTRKTTEQNAKF